MNEQLMVTGRVNRSTYVSLKKYIMQPAFKIIYLCLIVVYDLVMIWQLIHDFSPANIVLLLGFTALMIFMYFFNQKSLVKRAVTSHPALKSGDGFEMTVHFEETGVRMYNHTRGSERNLPYSGFVSYADTDRCIALFVKGGNYLMVPKDNMDDALHDKVMAWMMQKCPKLHKRL